MASIEAIRLDREARERRAKQRADGLAPGEYYAAGDMVLATGNPDFLLQCESHWDAVLVLMARK